MTSLESCGVRWLVLLLALEGTEPQYILVLLVSRSTSALLLLQLLVDSIEVEAELSSAGFQGSVLFSNIVAQLFYRDGTLVLGTLYLHSVTRLE